MITRNAKARKMTDDRMKDFKPTTDLHYHMDAMSPRAIHEVSRKHDLPWAGKSLEEVKKLASVEQGAGWDEWYKVHSLARKMVFTKPEVFRDVAEEAVRDAELEGLWTRVMRFSLTMPQYCFKAAHGRSPDFGDPKDKGEFLDMLESIIWGLSDGLEGSERVKAPLVFSISCQDAFLPIIDDLAGMMIRNSKLLSGLDLTNEQVHRLPTHYKSVADMIRAGGVEALTVHVGEKEEDGQRFTSGERIRAALELNPDTIAHAIYAVKYPEVIEDMARSGVVLELCPTSNLSDEYIEKGLGGDPSNYPLLAFTSAGIPVTINSDVPGSFRDGTLKGEYELVHRVVGIGTRMFHKMDAIARETARKVYGI